MKCISYGGMQTGKITLGEERVITCPNCREERTVAAANETDCPGPTKDRAPGWGSTTAARSADDPSRAGW